MTWMETANGSKAHFVPVNNNVRSLCGAKADKYDPDDPPHTKRHCERCEKIKARADNGHHDKYESWEVN